MMILACGIPFFIMRWGSAVPYPIKAIEPFSGYVPLVISFFIINQINERHRKVVWLAHQVCPACGYNLKGNVSGVCPECGKAFKTDGPE
jgi:hypothetical protein